MNSYEFQGWRFLAWLKQGLKLYHLVFLVSCALSVLNSYLHTAESRQIFFSYNQGRDRPGLVTQKDIYFANLMSCYQPILIVPVFQILHIY